MARSASRCAGAWLAAVLAAAAPAAAQQAADWRAETPALPLDGAVRPMTTPVAVGGSAWGPWQRLCREQVTQRGRDPVRNCLAVSEARAEGQAMRLTLLIEEVGLRVTALRDIEGRVTEFAAVRADGSAPPPDPARDRLLAEWREQFASLSLERRSIPAREAFELPVRGSPRGMRCRADGAARLRGRPVVVLGCEIAFAGTLGASRTPMQVEMAIRMAVDVPTGMIVAQGYATRMERFNVAADGRRSSAGVLVTPTRLAFE